MCENFFKKTVRLKVFIGERWYVFLICVKRNLLFAVLV